MDKEILLWILTSLSGLAASFGAVILYGLREDVQEIKKELKNKPDRAEMDNMTNKLETHLKENCKKEHERIDRVLHTHGSSGESGEVVKI